jgi:hypothetical protein
MKKRKKKRPEPPYELQASKLVLRIFAWDELRRMILQHHDMKDRYWHPSSKVQAGEGKAECFLQDWGDGSDPLFILLYFSEERGKRTVSFFMLSEMGEGNMKRHAEYLIEVGRHGLSVGHHRDGKIDLRGQDNDQRRDPEGGP